MNKENQIELLSWLTIGLVFLIALGGFALSYNALRDVAIANGMTGWMSYVWPLLIDAALVVFSIAVFRASVLSERPHWHWFLVGVFTLGTIVFNLVHSFDDLTFIDLYVVRVPLRPLVAIVPPVALVLAFETLVGMVRGNINRHWLVKSTEELQAELDNLRQTKETEAGQAQAELDTLRQQWQDEADRHKDKLTALESQLSDLQGHIETKRQELADTGKQPVVIIGDKDPTKMGPAERQPYVAQMLNLGIEEGIILDTFQVSAKTLSRDKSSLNGQLNENNPRSPHPHPHRRRA